MNNRDSSFKWRRRDIAIIILTIMMIPSISSARRLTLNMQVAFSTSFPVLGSSAMRLAEKIENGGSDIKIQVYEPGKLVAPFEILDAVSKGVVNTGYSTAGYWEGRLPGISLFGALPFSSSARKHYQWMINGGGLERYQSVYDKAGYNVKVIPCGMVGPEGFGWFRRPIHSPSDLKGLRIRFFGLGGKVMQKLGSRTVSLPGGEIILAIEKSVIDATEFSAPYIDEGLRFDKYVTHYYYPAWHARFTMFELLINRKVWDKMPDAQKELIQKACHQNVLWSIAEDERLTATALEKYRKRGVKIAKVPEAILEAAKNAWEKVAREMSEKSPEFRRNYANYRARFPANAMLAELKTGIEQTYPPPPKLAETDTAAPLESRKRSDTPAPQLQEYAIEPLDEEFHVVKKSNVRLKPAVTASRTMQLKKGEIVTALGKVKGTNWILVAKKDKPVGYVYGSMLKAMEESDAVSSAAPSNGDQAAARASQTAALPKGIDFGRYHALVIGINVYQHLPSLMSAIPDARAVSDLLKRDYGFTVKLLINPNRNAIIDNLDGLRGKLLQKDNLLIYYAGHGYYDSDADRGYWLPADAQVDRRSNWVSNATITDTLRAMKAKHILIVADSCYSGTLTRDSSKLITLHSADYYRKNVRRRSRSVLTSGGLEPVIDSGGGNHSIFAKEFMDTLKNNTRVLDGIQLYTRIRRAVTLNADQTPMYSDIRKTGHEDGEFFFVRKK